MDQVKKLFETDGVVIFRGALQNEVVASWAVAYANLHNPDRVPEWNKVAVNEGALQPLLDLIATHPVILDAVECIFGPDIALYNKRFVVKDRHARDPVFLHQDSCYHVGGLEKASAFVPLSPVTPENGGLVFYPGTHMYGYLGDAGEIHPKWKLMHKAICPSLNQGDFVLMHSATWHESGPNTNGIDRILADIHYQPSSDPSGKELLRGEWKRKVEFPDGFRDEIFARSRSSRIIELQQSLTAVLKDIEE